MDFDKLIDCSVLLCTRLNLHPRRENKLLGITAALPYMTFSILEICVPMYLLMF